MSTTTTQKAKASWLGRQAAKTDPPVATDEQIRRRAYEIYLARGGKPGDPVKDWLQAKQELTARLARQQGR